MATAWTRFDDVVVGVRQAAQSGVSLFGFPGSLLVCRLEAVLPADIGFGWFPFVWAGGCPFLGAPFVR